MIIIIIIINNINNDDADDDTSLLWLCMLHLHVHDRSINVCHPASLSSRCWGRRIILDLAMAMLLEAWSLSLSRVDLVICLLELLGSIPLPLRMLTRTQPNVCSQTRWAAGIMILALDSSTWALTYGALMAYLCDNLDVPRCVVVASQHPSNKNTQPQSRMPNLRGPQFEASSRAGTSCGGGFSWQAQYP